ncbi:MAG: secretin N-terminal domain-containing protein [Planctomycetia bacterium]|nr:secretin N-terminal domain-containing protein [Planctomycetia bacterium]
MLYHKPRRKSNSLDVSSALVTFAIKAIGVMIAVTIALTGSVNCAYAQNVATQPYGQRQPQSIYVAQNADLATVPTEPAQAKYQLLISPRFREITQDPNCLRQTFNAPTNHGAAVTGALLLHLLPNHLKERTAWSYDANKNEFAVYGTQEALDMSEKLLAAFSDSLFEAFLATEGSGESDSEGFVSVTGLSNPRQNYVQPQTTGQSYYDPEKNEVVKVAYEANGALIPNRDSYAVAFGAGDPESGQTATVVEEQEKPTLQSVLNQGANTNPLASLEDSILDVVVYRCSPALCGRVAELAQRQFAAYHEIAFNVNDRLGTIVVHTNRRLQREVSAFMASLQVYPAKQSAYEPDMRIATGDITRIDGVDADETDAQRAARQVFDPRNEANPAQASLANMRSATLEDVYRPAQRSIKEVQDTLIKLFDNRLVRLQVDPNQSVSQRQVDYFRFFKRPDYEGQDATTLRSCDLEFDNLNNRIILHGDPNLCAQMLVLLRAIDQPPLTNGKIRRFIPIREGDSKKLQQIFEYNAASSARALYRNSAPLTRLQVAKDLLVNRYVDPEAYLATATSAQRAEQLLDRLVDPWVKKVVDNAANRSVLSSLDTEVYQAIAALNRNDQLASFGVRQVSYQEDVGGLSDLGGGASDFDDMQRGRGGVGVVQDFNPIVLQDLDVVIVDNATAAEFERIKQMIEQIEELAKIAEIETEIYNLKHVDCAMLHGVLTTLYAEMFTSKQGRVVFYALQNPNAILVAGWGRAFEDMKNLIQLFDQPITEGAGTLRVVRLKYASVDEIAALLTETFVTPQTTGTGGFAPRIRAFADIRTNSLIVQAAPNDWEEIQKILMELDVNKADTKLVTRIFPLKNSLAEDIRTTITNILIPAKQGTLDTSAAKFPILELLSVDDTGRRLVQSGVMMDVDVAADVYHNQLIISAPEDCMEFMERLVELLDVAPKKAQIRFFQVRNGDATQIMTTLRSLLASSDDNIATPTIPQVEGEETFVPVRFALDTRTNVIIAAAAPRELAIIDALVVALDVKDATVREEEVVQLRNIQALVVAEAIDDYLSQKQTLETASEVLSNYQLLESQVIVIPESISNSIIVSAAPEQMTKILDMIKTFDQDPPQVVIQVLIAEVTLSNQEEFGIEAGFQNSTSFDRSMITSTSSGATGQPGFDIVSGGGPGKNLNASNSVTDVAGQVLNNFAMGTSNSTLGYGGFVLAASSRSIDITLRALREKNRLQVLSRPQVTAMDNQQAFILVGQRVPRISGTTTTNYGVQMNTTETPVGLILLVTPRVTKDGRVVMEIGAEKSSLGNDSDATPIYSQNGEVIKSKSIDTIQAMTAISARDGETVMLGGLLTSNKEKISRGVPYLSDIPVVGWFFRYDQEVETRKELLIVMTPRIMRNPSDFQETLRLETKRTNVNLSDAMAINGNMGLYDPLTDQGYQSGKKRGLIRDLVHPDKMDELRNVPQYSPANDYAPRPIDDVAAADHYSAARNSNATRQRYSWTQQEGARERGPFTTSPAARSVDQYEQEEQLLLNDDFARNSANTRGNGAREVQRVAQREDQSRQTARNQTLDVIPRSSNSTPNSARLLNEERAAVNASRASDLRAAGAPENAADNSQPKRRVGISNYRNNASASSAQTQNVETPQQEYNEPAQTTSATIRGQEISVDGEKFKVKYIFW